MNIIVMHSFFIAQISYCPPSIQQCIMWLAILLFYFNILLCEGLNGVSSGCFCWMFLGESYSCSWYSHWGVTCDFRFRVMMHFFWRSSHWQIPIMIGIMIITHCVIMIKIKITTNDTSDRCCRKDGRIGNYHNKDHFATRTWEVHIQIVRMVAVFLTFVFGVVFLQQDDKDEDDSFVVLWRCWRRHGWSCRGHWFVFGFKFIVVNVDEDVLISLLLAIAVGDLCFLLASCSLMSMLLSFPIWFPAVLGSASSLIWFLTESVLAGHLRDAWLWLWLFGPSVLEFWYSTTGSTSADKSVSRNTVFSGCGQVISSS